MSKKRLICAMLTIIIVTGLLPIGTIQAAHYELVFSTSDPNGILTETEVTAQLAFSGVGTNDTYSVTFDEAVQSIGGSAFPHLPRLTGVVVQDSVTSIDSFAFDNCHDLAEIIVSEANSAYSSHGGVLFNKERKTLILYPQGKSGVNYIIPDSLTSIGDFAFSYCTRLTGIVIPDSLTSIGDYAFYGCSSLASIVIPDSVTSIGRHAFYGCSGLVEIVVMETSYTFSTIDGVLFNKDKTNIIRYPEGKPGDYYIIPDRVTTIGHAAFYNCSNLSSIVIPNGVTIISGSAFAGCTNLSGIVIPNGVTIISGSSFYGCSSLTNILIPDSVTTIASSAFSGCSSLTSIVIPDSVTTIGEHVFNNTRIHTITLPPSIQRFGVTMSSGPFSDMPDLENIVFKPGTEGIPANAFFGITNPVNVYMPKSVISISPGDGLGSNTTVYAFAESFAEQYVKDNGIPYETMPTVVADRLPIGYQFLPYSFSFASSDGAWLEVVEGKLPDGLKVSLQTDTKRTQGEIWGAPLEFGTFEVKVRATNGTPFLLMDDEITFTIIIEEYKSNVWLEFARLYDAHIIEHLGKYDPVEGIYIVDVFETNPEDVQMVFDHEFDDFIDLWIDGVSLNNDVNGNRDGDYFVKDGSTAITIYGQTFNGVNKTPQKGDNVISAEFKTGGEADGKQYMVAQTFKINVVKKPPVDITPTPTQKPEPPPGDDDEQSENVIPDIETPLASPTRYDDVAPADWFFDAVEHVSENGLMIGTGARMFSPNVSMSRAMLVTVLYRLEGETEENPEFGGQGSVFSDVVKGAWYYDAVIWAAEKGIVEGYNNGAFGISDPVTREQTVAILYRYAISKEFDVSAVADLSGYTDTGDIYNWALDAMKWAVAEGIVQGRTSTNIAPKGTSTRAEVATIIMRYIERFLD